LFPNPRCQHNDSGFGERGTSFLPAFSVTTNMSAIAEVDPGSLSIAEGWRTGAVKALKRQFAAFVGERDCEFGMTLRM
jgi:hypothetical protein